MRNILEIQDRVQVQNPKLKTHGKFGTVMTDGNAPHNLPANTQGYIFGVKLEGTKTVRFFKESNLQFVERVIPEHKFFDRTKELKCIKDHPEYDTLTSPNASTVLRNMDLSGYDLSPIALNGRTIINCNFNESNIYSLHYADVQNCSFESAFIYQARGADVVDCNMEGVEFGFGSHHSVKFKNCNLKYAKMAGRFEDATFINTETEGMNVTDAEPEDGDMWPGLRIWGSITVDMNPNQINVIHRPTGLGNRYTVIFLGDHIQIGCQGYKRSEWENFTARKISNMDVHYSTHWWSQNKEALFKAHDEYLSEIAK